MLFFAEKEKLRSLRYKYIKMGKFSDASSLMLVKK